MAGLSRGTLDHEVIVSMDKIHMWKTPRTDSGAQPNWTRPSRPKKARPAVAVSPVDLEEESPPFESFPLEPILLTTVWSPHAYRRAIANACFAWKSLEGAGRMSTLRLRKCFATPVDAREESVFAWCRVMSLIFDVWHHIKNSMQQPNSRLQPQTSKIRVSIASLLENECTLGWNGPESQTISSLLTNIGSFLASFPDTVEHNWTQVRSVSYDSPKHNAIITSRM